MDSNSTEAPPQIRTRQERLRRLKHKKAQQKYREKNEANLEVEREKARLRMRAHRAAIKESPQKKKLASEQRREADSNYRERQRQTQWIEKFGKDKFRECYLPQYEIHGNQTHKIKWELETKEQAKARWLAEGLDSHGHPIIASGSRRTGAKKTSKNIRKS
ncbi:hypothetical protein C8R44DRAFT_873848 [Mycena epipterygia]|nr:hypothetical protein C8R44DRAFT_873848 [Mycena epipterygia]